jgi:hypothetical protein
MSEHEQLIRLGFTVDGVGVLHAPAASRVTLKPIAPSYYEIRIRIGGNQISCVVASVALKLGPAIAPVVDPEALISGTPRGGRPW